MKKDKGLKSLKSILFLIVLLVLGSSSAFAQQYSGMSGLVHVPSADMDKAGDVRLGAHFLNREFTPGALKFQGEKYHTMTHYLSITPFRWMEIGYTCTLLRSSKTEHGVENPDKVGLYRKDRSFSFKLRPIAEKEGKWWPSVAIGTNDAYPVRKGEKVNPNQSISIGNSFFANAYIAMTKHIEVKRHILGFHLAYRQWNREENREWNGVVGGITYNPSFAGNLRAVVEYTGDDINIGMDCLLWKHLLLQASLQDGRYFSGGVCFRMNLF